MSNDPQDFTTLTKVVTGFEKLSGAILSRDMKCRVLGLGKWANKEDWPLQWLKPVRSVSVWYTYYQFIFRNDKSKLAVSFE